MSIDGNRAIVSSTQDTIGANAVQGSAYLFIRNGTAWTQQVKFPASDGAANDGFGISIGISGGNAVVDAIGDDIGSNSAQGSVYIFSASLTPARALFDFDVDGKADVPVFRPLNGVWYLQQSTNGFTAVSFGQNGDRVAPADYDGDGRADVAVFRDDTWYLNRSLQSFTGISFGAATDKPAPNAFIF